MSVNRTVTVPSAETARDRSGRDRPNVGGDPANQVELPEPLDGRDLLEFVEIEQLANLDLAVLVLERGLRVAERPLHRLLARHHVDQRVAGDQVIVAERSLDHLAGSVGPLQHPPRLRCGMEPHGVDQDAGLVDRLMERELLGDLLLHRHRAGLGRRRGADEDHEPH